jgi:four helix bundle protein
MMKKYQNRKGEKSLKGGKSEKSKAAQYFEDLHIYQRVRELVNAIYTVTRDSDFRLDLGLVDQIRRAAVSIMSNIAEGFERGSKTEFIQFLYIAKGSCGEVRAQLQIAQDQNYIQFNEYRRLYDLCKQISGMISNFIAHLQKTDYQGEKIGRAKRLNQQNNKQRMDEFFASHGIKLPGYVEQDS